LKIGVGEELLIILFLFNSFRFGLQMRILIGIVCRFAIFAIFARFCFSFSLLIVVAIAVAIAVAINPMLELVLFLFLFLVFRINIEFGVRG
jgi:hypothetical protein